MNDKDKLTMHIAAKRLSENNIWYETFNNGYHWKIGYINFYPTTGLWQSDNLGGDKGRGIDSLLRVLKKTKESDPNVLVKIEILSVEQMFMIAKKVKPMNLENVCKKLHESIYKGVAK